MRFAKPLTLALVITLAVIAGAARSAEPQSGEYLVKAAFIYNIAKFVEWPPGTFETDSSPVVLCILGKDPFGGSLKTIEGKAVQGRPLIVRHIERVEDPGPCHILFISSSEAARLPQILAHVKDARILTIADMPRFAQNGGVINLVTMENRIGMEINTTAAEQARIQISSKLLKLARIVNGQDRG
jgi:hypothetical protein